MEHGGNNTKFVGSSPSWVMHLRVGPCESLPPQFILWSGNIYGLLNFTKLIKSLLKTKEKKFSKRLYILGRPHSCYLHFLIAWFLTLKLWAFGWMKSLAERNLQLEEIEWPFCTRSIRYLVVGFVLITGVKFLPIFFL